MDETQHTEEQNTLLQVKDLLITAETQDADGKKLNLTLVDKVSFDLEKGRVLGLIGESGAGKSTIGLSSLAYGRYGCTISGGQIILGGEDILQYNNEGLYGLRGGKVTYVAQSAAASFNPSHRLENQVIEAAVNHHVMSRREALDYARLLFKKLDLPDPDNIGRRFPHQVSGGQLQRVMTAMALASKPDLVVFDEPTTALDVTTQLEVLAAIKEAIHDFGTAALYITHDLAVVAQVSDEIMVLRHGKMVEHGETEQILHRPNQEYTRELVNVRKIEKEEKSRSDKTPLLSIENVTASYTRTRDNLVLKDVSMALEPGHTLAVVGESGSGKSTTARVITGLLPPLEGQVLYNGQPLSPQLKDRNKEQLRVLQMIYQMPDVAINPRQTVRDIIGRPLTFYFNLRGKAREDRVQQLLEQIEIDPALADRFPAELSGGQKQRICIARALAAEPDLIICDEVTSALDPLVADGILKLLLRLQEETNVAYLFITHDIATVRAIADSVAVMYQGGVVTFGSKADVLSPPHDDYTDLLLSSVPEMEIGWLEKALKSRKMAAAGN